MEVLWTNLVAVVIGVLGSNGLWSIWLRSKDKKSSSTKLMMGLAHMEIVRTGLRFIARGWLTKAEYHDYLTYLVDPYEDLGGNGTADRIFQEVDKLPIRDKPPEEWEFDE